ncbi:MAG: Do family serine endopeptidase [Porphyromonadaceae bacterium]|jgi:Do/DeqQ family serine protease|nr:Do family serine endopeptidase [Porphyromonadaceae bacterium]
MTERKSRTSLFMVLLIIAVSAATSWATTFIQNKNYGVEFIETTNQSNQQEIKARFANAQRAFETDFTVAAELSVHAVVHVKTKAVRQQRQNDFFSDPFFEFFFGPQQRGQRNPQQQQNPGEAVPLGAGSGVIISNDGYVVTNNHVIDGASEIEITLNDKRSFKAKLIGTDPSTDIALLKVDGKDLPYISFGDSDNIKVGEWVLAVGNPFNLTSTVTAGIVSAKARNLGIIGTDRYGRRTEKLSIESFIQTDAAINPGNSGGALVNTKGELVGINTAIASQTGSYAGYGFAVPTSIVKKVVTDLREHGVVQRALLGVSIGDITTEVAKEKNIKVLNGALVADVVSGGAAEKAGIKADDVINEVNGVKVNSTAELQEQVSRYRPGDKITLGFVRNNKQMKVNVTLMNAEGTMDVVSTNKFQQDLGVQLKPISDTVKEALGIDTGLEVVTSSGKFREQGIQQGYIILKINNRNMASVKDFENVYNDAQKSNKTLNIAGVYPTTGKITYYKIELGK